MKNARKHILLVEDEFDVGTVTKTRLELEGFKVSIVNDGMSALDFVAKEQPDLMLLDLHMPKMDGYQVYKRLKSNQTTKNIPVILFTGSDEYLLALEKKSLEMSVDGLISKPYDTKILLKKILNLTKSNKTRKA